ncbi:MAG: hypothetical protein A2365_01800 [Candidatus Nealsonbacteria bacterium RIFOXYB1_FULL_40_15]|uniref:Cytoplasmic protein n=2 Tax=Candidatus Nealsoniibacteriota TaxID=1817911 RepID=A0A1G2ELZ8_9BACT|nr:MAG: hypothetical protein A2427_00630 [Candidatus Nealsonbacteria bacterium RIFOXYC1_FULL_40_7]OGZ27580.1 MAG: hypothetical protein A2365_01800 [Candidatus Nealsonbacteria bacterium RIFOXYB1_FULL_40_15]OGZ29274.1 MAG: hypothetical protein A2562_00385 [Candidatus Nealsonbacteria bacterium RIFOXYD1_FULL_39_11]
MPRFDGTGPGGAGSKTGWGRGPCGSGLRRCFGRFWSNPILTKDQEIEVLSSEAESLEEELKAVKNRLEELKK